MTTTVAHAQLSKTDSLTAKLKQDSAWIYRQKIFLFRLATDQRNTFLRTSKNKNVAADMFGIQIGGVFYGRHNTGIGIYGLRKTSRHINNLDGHEMDVTLNFDYMSLYYEYFFIKSRWWRIGIPVELGYGKYQLTGKDLSAGSDLGKIEGRVVPISASLDVAFKPTPRWWAIHLTGGYRYVAKVGDGHVPIDLSNYYYSIGISVYLREIYQDSRYYLKKTQISPADRASERAISLSYMFS